MTLVRAVPRPNVPILQFLGGTGTVTGSRFLVDTRSARVLVDCGLYQGLKEFRLRNWGEFPVDPGSIDAVVLTHAHVDHSGYLPALYAEGFRGDVFATAATCDLARILLPDSARLQEEEAEYGNRKGFTKHDPARPLFNQQDADRVLELFSPVPFDREVPVAYGIQASFRPAGHILGSASVTLTLEDEGPRRIAFSGDLGRPNHPLLAPPAPPPDAHVMLIESTYGDREHQSEDAVDRLGLTIAKTAERGGVVVIPAFAVDRTEVLLMHVAELMRRRTIPELPVYVDSPMALSALQVYRRAIAEGNPQIRPELRGRKDLFDVGTLVETREVAESKAIGEASGPAIIVSASGMATGGRVLHHLKKRLPDRRNSVVFTGFQAAGTRGRQLLEGAHTVKIFGRYIPVHAEIADITEFSVHADRSELVDWLKQSPSIPEIVFVVHGEPEASDALRVAIEEQLDWCVSVPRYLERVRLDRND